MSAAAHLGQFVPTVRDRYGRIRVPALINGKGPFSLILDTGANHSAVSSDVATSLGATLDQLPPMIMHGVTGSTIVPAIQVDSITLGTFQTPPTRLPIVLDALDGADGFFSTNSFVGRRIVIDLQHDRVALSDTRSGRAGPGYVTLRADLSNNRMFMVNARINGVFVKTIIDTGASATIGNLAMQNAILSRRASGSATEEVIGTTATRQIGAGYLLPPIALGSLWVLGTRISYGDMPIFRQFGFSSIPAMLMGMDVLGQFDSLVLDFRSKELQLRPRARSHSAQTAPLNASAATGIQQLEPGL